MSENEYLLESVSKSKEEEMVPTIIAAMTAMGYPGFDVDDFEPANESGHPTALMFNSFTVHYMFEVIPVLKKNGYMSLCVYKMGLVCTKLLEVTSQYYAREETSAMIAGILLAESVAQKIRHKE